MIMMLNGFWSKENFFSTNFALTFGLLEGILQNKSPEGVSYKIRVLAEASCVKPVVFMG